MIKYLILILLIGLLLGSSSLFAQKGIDSISSAQGPMEMPEVIIDRNINLNIKSTTKKFPQNTPHLSSAELDSINSLEKQTSLLLPKPSLAKSFISPLDETAFIEASFGQWASINARAGYTFDLVGFDVYTLVSTEASAGWVDNADYSKIDLSLNSSYLADPKFWIFGSSNTKARFDFNYANYNHYAIFSPFQRTSTNFSFLSDTKGSYQGFDFRAGILTDIVTLSDPGDVGSGGFGAYLDIINPYDDFKFLGGGELDIRSDLNQSNNLINAYGGIQYRFQNNIIMKSKLGYYLADSPQNASKGLSYELITSFNPNSNNSLILKIDGGLDRTLLRDLLARNPYISSNATIFHSEKTIGVNTAWEYKFGTKWAITTFASFDKYSEYLNFYNIDSAKFNISGGSADIVKIGMRSFYEINDKNLLSLDLLWQSGMAETNSTQVTYLPELDAKASWSVFWGEDISTQTYAHFIGKRYFSIALEEQLDQYINLGLSINYRLYNHLFINISADNLLNQNIYYYNNYQEGGIFGKIGVNLKI